MAHAVETMLSIRETPWHGLGKVIKQNISFERGLTESGLDWDVKLYPITAAGQKLEHLGRAVVRESDRKVLGIVGPNWRPLQNREAFAWFKPFADSGAVQLETAGSLHGGRIVWVLARIVNESAEVTEGDNVLPYVLLSNAHDGSQAVRCGFTPIRVVCWNTLSQSHRSEASQLLRVKHTRQLKPTLAEIREIMNLAVGEFQATAAQYRRLAMRKINKEDLRRYVTKVIATAEDETTPQERTKIDEVIRLAIEGRGNKGQDLSLWTAYNGVTEYMSWQQGRSADTRYESLWFGKGSERNREAFEIALQLAG